MTEVFVSHRSVGGEPERQPRVSRRALLSLAGGLFVSGCAGTPLGRASQALDHAMFGYPGVPLSRKRIDAIPYASMAARIGKGPRSLIILSAVEGDHLIWVSADRVAIVTLEGRVVKTAGLPENLVGTQFLGPDPVANLANRDSAFHAAERLVNLVPPDEYDVSVKSRFTREGTETIEIVGIRFETVRFREDCDCPILQWRFTNRYWADARTGFVWKSRQHVHPDIPVVAFEVLKPAAA